MDIGLNWLQNGCFIDWNFSYSLNQYLNLLFFSFSLSYLWFNCLSFLSSLINPCLWVHLDMPFHFQASVFLSFS